KAASGGNAGTSRRGGATRMTFTLTFNDARRNARSKDCLHGSVSCHIRSWQNRNKSGKQDRCRKKSLPGSAGNNCRENDQVDETEEGEERKGVLKELHARTARLDDPFCVGEARTLNSLTAKSG